MKFARVPQTPEPISAVSGPKFTILSGRVEEVLLLNEFLFRLSIHASVAKIWPGKVVRWCRDGDYLHPVFAAYSKGGKLGKLTEKKLKVVNILW